MITLPAIDGFTFTPNAYDYRVECDLCRDSATGSIAFSWAMFYHALFCAARRIGATES